MIFMGPLFRKEQEKQLLELSDVGISNAANIFQWNVIEGLLDNDVEKINIINTLPVGIWPRQYKRLALRDGLWEFKGCKCYEVGCLNLPFIKQFDRSIRASRYIKELIKCDKEVLIYSAYMPFLKAVYKLPKTVKITVIITDLPEYYDLQGSSFIRRVLRKKQNKMVYKYLKRADRFVLLTEQMKDPLVVKDRPYTVVEGICDTRQLNVEPLQNKKIVFYSGTLNYCYGIKKILDAFKLIEDADAKLWICGAGEAENEIKEMSQKDERIKFYGFLPLSEVEKLRAQASILVNPRTNDGEYTKYSFPSKTMEYMASGVPVVMYKLDGVPDEYDEYLTYIKDDSTEALAKLLSDVLNLPAEERARIGERARAFVFENKNIKMQVRKILNLLEVKNAE